MAGNASAARWRQADFNSASDELRAVAHHAEADAAVRRQGFRHAVAIVVHLEHERVPSPFETEADLARRGVLESALFTASCAMR